MGQRETQPFATEGHEPLQRWRIGAQRRRPEQEGLLDGALVLVEQDDHQAGAAAEATEQGAFAHARRRGDVVHGDGVGAPLGDQGAGGVEQE